VPVVSELHFAGAVTLDPSMTGLLPDWFDPGREDGRLRLHIGGRVRRPGWKVLDVQPGAVVDFVGNCRDLSQFASESVSAIYASHILEHLGFRDELPCALAEIRRTLMQDGPFLMSVPDLEILSRLFLDSRLTVNERMITMMMMFGGQGDEHDYHHVGLYREFLARLFGDAGFRSVKQVPRFGLFPDSSDTMLCGEYISLNLVVS
jgi:predicted SAM-dependent methyltransferase